MAIWQKLRAGAALRPTAETIEGATTQLALRDHRLMENVSPPDRTHACARLK